jgi:glycosyltransferase involved in cell wall biosynthesis
MLSTYNGETFLEELIESILTQTVSEIDILIRDDGSTDQTTEILQKFACNQRVTLLVGSRIGIQKSYQELFNHAFLANKYEYFAFADQDDVWVRDKIQRGLSYLSTAKEGAFLYCSGYTVVAKDRGQIGEYRPPSRYLHPSDFYLQNLALGATQIFNLSAAQFISRMPFIEEIMHDAWAGLAISVFGRVYIDDFLSMEYRQHENNAVGLKKNPATLKKFNDNLCLHIRAISHFLYLSKRMNTNDPIVTRSIHELESFIQKVSSASLATRATILFSKTRYREKILHEAVARLLLAIDRESFANDSTSEIQI